MRAEELLRQPTPEQIAALADAEAAHAAAIAAEKKAEKAVKRAQAALNAAHDATVAARDALGKAQFESGARAAAHLAWLRENHPTSRIVVKSNRDAVGIITGGGWERRQIRQVVSHSITGVPRLESHGDQATRSDRGWHHFCGGLWIEAD
jgi:hypothetical protein